MAAVAKKDDAGALKLLSSVASHALPFVVLGGVFGALYKTGSLMAETPDELPVSHVLVNYKLVSASPRLRKIFDQLDRFLTIHPKWAPCMLSHLEYICGLNNDFINMRITSDLLLEEVKKIGILVSSTKKSSGEDNDADDADDLNLPAEDEEANLRDILEMASDRYDEAIESNLNNTPHKRRKQKLKSSVVKHLLDIISNLRSLIYDSNILLESALEARRIVSNLCDELKNTMKLFNNYWSQCGKVILSDPSVHVAKAASLKEEMNSNKSHSLNKQMMLRDDRLLQDAAAEEMISKKSTYVDILYNGGHLPGDDLSSPLPSDRFGSEVFLRWWIKMHCQKLPTMQPIGVEFGFCIGPTYEEIVAANKAAALNGRKSKANGEVIPGQTFVFKPNSKLSAFKERPCRKSGYLDQLKFLYLRSVSEGVKNVFSDPWAGYRPGLGELQYVPIMTLDEGKVNALLDEITNCVNIMIDKGMFIHQLKTIDRLNNIHKKARLFFSTGIFNDDTNTIHNFFAMDKVLFEKTLDLLQQWRQAENPVV